MSTETPSQEIIDDDVIMPTDMNSTDNSDSAGQEGINVELILIAVRVLIGVVGFMGNAIVCLVVAKMAGFKVKFLISTQAIIDLLTSIALVAITLNYLPQLALSAPKTSFLGGILGYLYCMLWWDEILLFGLFSISTYNLVAISIERYITVLHPLWYRSYYTKRKSIILGMVVWTIAPTMQITWFAAHRAYDSTTGQCYALHLPHSGSVAIGVLIFVWDFFIPCCIMGFCFTRIVIELVKQDARSKSMQSYLSNPPTTDVSVISTVSAAMAVPKTDQNTKGSAATESRSRNVTKTFIIVFLVFVLCWMTNQLLFLQWNLGFGYEYFRQPISHFAKTMALLNSACNPFIYVLNLKQYRDQLKSFFC